MTNADEDKRVDFAARAFEHKGRAEAHRLRAEMVDDPTTKAIHTNAAASYDRMAVELDSTNHFVLGVQWHPERTYTASSLSRAIFAGFGHAAGAWRPRPIEVSVAST